MCVFLENSDGKHRILVFWVCSREEQYCFTYKTNIKK
jgi:hypothetical protein